MKRAYTKLPTLWLNDYRVMNMPDAEFRKFVIDYAGNNIQYEYDVKPERKEFQAMYDRIAPEVMGRDGSRCQYCGSTERLEIDHITPLAKGGTNDLDNLQVLCRTCNRKKGTK